MGSFEQDGSLETRSEGSVPEGYLLTAGPEAKALGPSLKRYLSGASLHFPKSISCVTHIYLSSRLSRILER